MPEEWRRDILVPIFKNKRDVQSCTNYRGINLMSHTMKLWERVIEHRLKKVRSVTQNQFGFMPGRSTMEATFLIRQLMERYREQKKYLHMVFIDLERHMTKYREMSCGGSWRSTKSQLSTLPSLRPPEAPVCSGVLERVDNVKRGRGRPKLTWDESVKRDLKDWNISKEIALDGNNDGSLKKISCIDPQEGYLESSYQCA